jgi:hypothetical protein
LMTMIFGMKVIIIQFSLHPCSFLSFRSKHNSQHPILRYPWPVFIPYGEIKVHTPTKQTKLYYHSSVVQKYQLTANRCMQNLMFIIKYAFIVILEFSYELYCQGLNMNTTFHSCTVHFDII